MTAALVELCAGAQSSILFGRERPLDVDDAPETTALVDLRVDHVIRHLAGERDEFALAGLFRAPVGTAGMLLARQRVFADLTRVEVRRTCRDFSSGMQRALGAMRIADGLDTTLIADRWRLRAMEDYIAAVRQISGLGSAGRRPAPGLREAVDTVTAIHDGPAFSEMAHRTTDVLTRLRELRYAVHVSGGRIIVGSYDQEPDIETTVFNTFSRFRPEDTDVASAVGPTNQQDYDPVRDQIVVHVARLHPELITAARSVVSDFSGFLDPTTVLMYRELQFFLRYLDLVDRLEASADGIEFCRDPDVSFTAGPGPMTAGKTFDLALALSLVEQGRAEDLVTNDLELGQTERTAVITGPNNGGKTTMARTIGQLHHFASLGCPVPGRSVRLSAPDHLLTHFDREEAVTSRGSKLESDVRHLHEIVELATPRSLVILNETFSSTTAQDASDLGAQLLTRLASTGCRCVYVTFIDELSRLDHSTVSMTSLVDDDDPSRRTYRVIRRSADGRAYAESLARQARLGYDQVVSRLSR